MSAYFPYSQLVQNICNNIKENITRHAYFAEWSVSEQSQAIPQTSSVGISEIYY